MHWGRSKQAYNNEMHMMGWNYKAMSSYFFYISYFLTVLQWPLLGLTSEPNSSLEVLANLLIVSVHHGMLSIQVSFQSGTKHVSHIKTLRPLVYCMLKCS